MSFDPAQYRADFPILSRQVHGQPLVYLDNAATSQKPKSVIQAISEYYEQHNANVHRGVHQLGDESTQIFHAARKKIADFLGADTDELIIVRNETEAANQMAYTWGENHVQAGDVIVVSEMDHHSNIVPWQMLAERQGATVQFVAVTETGELDQADFTGKISQPNVKIVAFSHVSNTLGTLNPVKAMAALVKKNHPSALVFIDGAQAAPHLPVNFHDLGVDAYAVSAHKMVGPMGIGGLLVSRDILKNLSPFLYGGGMIDQVTTSGTTFIDNLEERFTAGTPDVASLAGWAAAVEYLQKIGMAELLEHDQELVQYTLEQLATFPQIKIIGPLDPAIKVGSVAFIYEGVHAHDLGQILDSAGVAVRSGHHCTMPLHIKLGLAASSRVSFQLYTTKKDIDMFITALKKVKQVFGK